MLFISEPRINVDFTMPYFVPSWHDCWRIRYLSVSLTRGDSEEVDDDLLWANTLNDMRYVPLNVMCPPDHGKWAV